MTLVMLAVLVAGVVAQTPTSTLSDAVCTSGAGLGFCQANEVPRIKCVPSTAARGFDCVLPPTTSPPPTTVPPLDGCRGERNCPAGSGPGCPCGSGNSCGPGLRCNTQRGRCYTCPQGEKGCACTGAQTCNAGLVCLGVRCESDGSAQFGALGQACYQSTAPNTACDSGSLFCSNAQCRACDPASGLGAGCECSDSNDCVPGLTCDIISSTCVPCYAECTNKCMREAKVNTKDPATYCPTLGCEACRDVPQCKWCNRAGDRSCVSGSNLCPSLYANGDDFVQCGGELLAETFPSKEELECTVRTCRGCAMSDKCKFCHSNGDWRCVLKDGQCPSGTFEQGGEQICLQPKCGTDCAGHGTCAFDKYLDTNKVEISGRPICVCEDDWRPDEKAGCIKLTVFENKNLRNTTTANIGVFVGLLVGLVVFCGIVAFLAVYLRRRARRTVMVVDVIGGQDVNAPLEVKDDGTVQTADGKVGFKCMVPGCPKAYLTLEDLRNHEQLRHGSNGDAGGGGGGGFSGATFNNGATMAAPPPAFGSYEQQQSMAQLGQSAAYDNNRGYDGNGGW